MQLATAAQQHCDNNEALLANIYQMALAYEDRAGPCWGRGVGPRPSWGGGGHGLGRARGGLFLTLSLDAFRLAGLRERWGPGWVGKPRCSLQFHFPQFHYGEACHHPKAFIKQAVVWLTCFKHLEANSLAKLFLAFVMLLSDFRGCF